MEWIGKEHSCGRTQFDSELVISLEKRDSGSMFVFKFRKNSIFKILSNNHYIMIGKDGDNLYFKETESRLGFRVGNYTDNIKAFKVRAEKLNLKEENLGEYNLEFDSKLMLQYINFNRKLEKQISWETK